MTAKDQLSELELDLCDKNMEILDLNHELDEQTATNQAMTASMEKLQYENGDLEEEACGLFDKVNSNYYDKWWYKKLFSTTQFPKVNVIFSVIVDDR